jgi:hypothetical protein
MGRLGVVGTILRPRRCWRFRPVGSLAITTARRRAAPGDRGPLPTTIPCTGHAALGHDRPGPVRTAAARQSRQATGATGYRWGNRRRIGTARAKTVDCWRARLVLTYAQMRPWHRAKRGRRQRPKSAMGRSQRRSPGKRHRTTLARSALRVHRQPFWNPMGVVSVRNAVSVENKPLAEIRKASAMKGSTLLLTLLGVGWALVACSLPQSGLAISPTGPTATTVQSVPLEDLAVHMEGYADQLVRVEGLDEGLRAWPACAGNFPADEWLLVSRVPDYARQPVGNYTASDVPPSVSVRGSRLDAMSLIPFARVVVTGWVRLDEPQGCFSSDTRGATPVVRDGIREWYVQAVEVQCSVCATLPTATPTPIFSPTPRPTMTPVPPMFVSPLSPSMTATP